MAPYHQIHGARQYHIVHYAPGVFHQHQHNRALVMQGGVVAAAEALGVAQHEAAAVVDEHSLPRLGLAHESPSPALAVHVVHGGVWWGPGGLAGVLGGRGAPEGEGGGGLGSPGRAGGLPGGRLGG